MLYAIMNEEPGDISKYRSDISSAAIEITSKALQKQADAHYQNMQELLSDLKRLQATEDSPARDSQMKEIPSIAVLPFVNMSPDPDNEYFSDGLSEELINALTKLQGLRVVARTSAFRFRGKEVDIRDVGKQLNVTSVLEGSVRKAGNRLRITAQLINVADGYHLWSERYDREMEDVFAIQDEISQAIVDTLEIELLGKEQKNLVKRYTDNLDAYQLYLKGRYYFNRYTPEGPAKAIKCFNAALEHDPNYTPAYCGLADVHGQLGYWGFARPKDVLPKNEDYALKAVDLDKMSDEAHAVIGATYAYTLWNWAKAEHHFQRALTLNPNSHEAHLRYALYLTSMARFSEADSECKLGIQIDPLSPVAQSALSFNHFACGEYNRAIEICEKSLEVEPNFPIHYWVLWRANALRGEYRQAIEACRRTFTLWGHNETTKVMKQVSNETDYSALMRESAELMLAQADKRYVSAHDVALFFTHAGDSEKAVDWIKRSFIEREPRLHMLKVMPDFAKLNEFQEFKELITKLNL